MRSIVLCLILFSPVWSQEADEKQRSKNARELGKGGSETIPQLKALLADPSVEVRREAVRAIVNVGTQHSIDALIQATRDNDPEIQFTATDGIVNFYYPGYVQKGLQKLTSSMRGRFDRENRQVIEPFVVVREEAIVALGKLARGGASMDSRANAARALGILRGRQAIDDLAEALHSKNTQLIFESLIALQKIQDKSAAPKVTFLLRDLEPRVQVAAIETAGLLRNNSAVPDLQKVFDSDRGDKVRRAALGSLAMLPDESSRSYFQRGLTDKDDAIRAAAAEGIGRLAKKEDAVEMDKLFNSERKMAPRLAAAFALVALGQTSSAVNAPLTYLVNTLNSKSYEGVARPYLYELAREGQVRRTLYDYLKQATREEKVGIGQILAVSGGPDAIETLEWLSKDPNPEVAQEGVRALRTLRARLN